jgi:hypothetical protein
VTCAGASGAGSDALERVDDAGPVADGGGGPTEGEAAEDREDEERGAGRFGA